MMNGGEHIEREKELKREQERKLLRNMMAIIPDSVVVLDSELRIKNANRAFYRLFQTEPEMITGRKIADILKDEDGKLSAELARLFGTEDMLENFELRYQSEKLGERILNITARGIIVAEEEVVVIQDITGCRRAEEAENSRRSVDDSPLGIRIVSAEGETLYANRALLDIYGYDSIEELKTTPLKKRYTPESYAEHQVRKEKRQRGEAIPSNYEISIVRRNGEVVRLEVLRKEALWYGKRQFQTIYRDITERKRAEEALRESEARYHALVRLGAEVGEAIIMLQDQGEREGVHVFCNDGWLRITGYSEGELRNMSFFELVHPKDRDSSLGRHRSKMSGQSMPGLFEVTIMRKDGSEVPVELTSAWSTYQGKPANVAYIRDITERKQMEEAMAIRLAASEWQATCDSIADPLWLADKDFRIVRINKASARFFNSQPEELIGRFCYQVVHESEEPIPACPGLKTLEMKEPVTEEFFEPHLGIYVQVSVAPWLNERGEVVGFTHLVKDVTARKQAEEERERLVQKLEATVKELEAFAYTISHDLRGPLHTVRSFAAALQTDLERGQRDRMVEDTRAIASGINRMEHLLKRILEYSRAGKAVQPSENVPFSEIVKEALEQLAHQLISSGAAMSVVDDLPSVYVDRMRMVEVVANLIENSIDYRDSNRPLAIEIGRRCSDDKVVFFVRDNGIGIRPGKHEKIFDLFYRGDEASQGMGAGLAIARRIIEGHGGRIWAEGELGKGTTICFTLPSPRRQPAPVVRTGRHILDKRRLS